MTPSWRRTVMRLVGARERIARVIAVEEPLPWYRRVHLFAPGFVRELELAPTSWVRLWVPDLADGAALHQRACTIVDADPDAGTFALELVLHEPMGPAACWAQRVEVGELAEIAMTPRPSSLDTGFETFVLLGDRSALPAINSMLDAIPTCSTTHVILVGPEEATTLVRQRPHLTLSVVDEVEQQLTRLRSLGPDQTRCFLWAAGERDDVAAVRHLARREWRLARDRYRTQCYWTKGKPVA